MDEYIDLISQQIQLFHDVFNYFMVHVPKWKNLNRQTDPSKSVNGRG